MFVRETAARVEVTCPAKLNLFLEVLARRADGYHEIETLMTAVSIFDTLTVTPTNDGRVELSCDWAVGLTSANPSALLGELPPPEKNIVYKAAHLLRQRGGCSQGAVIRLVKRIPSAAGLGGASSDAAATLVAGNLAWKLGWSRERLAELAAELGSDIPFFLGRGSAICRGRGERIEPIRSPRLHVVVVKPPVGLSTPLVYSRCQPAKQPADIRQLQRGLESGRFEQIENSLVNRLQQPAAELTPWINHLSAALDEEQCAGHLMSGSGSSYFGICRSGLHARRVARRLRGRRLGLVYQATTMST